MATKLWAMGLMLMCTGLTSVAQVLYKLGTNNLTFNLLDIITNYFIIGGLCLYAIGSVMMLLAFRGGEVSVLYPIIATSYVWVALLSARFLGEHINSFKILGIFSIVFGVVFIGLGSKKGSVSKYTEAI